MEEIKKDEEVEERIVEEPEEESDDREEQEAPEEPEEASEDETIDAIEDRFERIEKAIDELVRRVNMFVEAGAVISDESAIGEIEEDLEEDFLVSPDELVLKLGD